MSKITGKNRTPSAICYNGLMQLEFPVVALAASQTDSTVQSRIVLPINYKIIAVSALVYGTVAGTASVNVVLGAGAPGAVAVQANQGTIVGQYPEDTVAAAGNKLFASDQAVTMTAEAVTTFYPQSNFNVVWPAGNELTLRTTTNGSGEGNLKVVLVVSPVDQNPMSPEQYAEYFLPSANTI